MNYEPPAGDIRPSEPLAIIGDIHGRLDLLEKLLPQLDPAARRIFVGDLIDRGEDSAGVLHQVYESSDCTTCIMGNHERMLLDFLEAPDVAGPRWLRNGGLQTLASFGIGGLSESPSGPSLFEAAKRLNAKLEPGLFAWMKHLPTLWTSGNVTVVHAAADPSQSVELQEDGALLWGHPDFLSRRRKDGQWIVHGHTVVETATIRPSRVAIDTGAYFTGHLSAAQIYPDGSLEFKTT